MHTHPKVLPVANGPDDPRLYHIDTEFRQLFVAMKQLLVNTSRIGKKSGEPLVTAALGMLQISGHPDIPAHTLFSPNRHFRVLAKFANTFIADDTIPDARRLSIRLMDPSRPTNLESGVFDLLFSTGSCFYTSSATQILRLHQSEAARIALNNENPEIVANQWRAIYEATSYALYSYYSQIPISFTSQDGCQWLARFRMIPAHTVKDATLYQSQPGQQPPFPPHVFLRREDETRSPTCLQEELRQRVTQEGVEFLLQIQLHALTASAAENERALNAMRPWPEEQCPWKTLGQVKLDSLVAPEEVEPLQFNPVFAPPELGIVLAQSPNEPASLNHLRALIYQVAAAARRDETFRQQLQDLIMPARKSPALSMQVASDDRQQEPVRTVCVVGAGATGLTAARQLEQNGYQVIVLESNNHVGGKCESVTIDGHTHDLGGHLCTSKYERLQELCSKMNVPLEDCSSAKIKRCDLQQGSATEAIPLDHRDAAFRKYMSLRKNEFSDIGKPGIAHCEQALAQPLHQWLSAHGLAGLEDGFRAGYTAAGFGYLQDDIAALYFAKYIEMIGFPLMISTSPLQSPQSFTIANGFQRLWESVAAALNDVRTDTRIRLIKRHEKGVEIHTDRGMIEVDDVIITLPLNQAAEFLPLAPEEQDIAQRVRSINYYTTVCTARGLPRNGLLVIEQNMQSVDAIGHCVAMHHRYHDSDVYVCFSYGNDNDSPEDIAAKLREDITRMGGELETIHLQRKWNYFPHFASADLQNGIHMRLEALQGKHHTYYAGSLLSFELVECNVAYAREMVDKFFPRRAAECIAPEQHKGVSKAVTEEEIHHWLVEHFARELHLEASAIDARQPLANFPLDSLSIVSLQAELAKWLGITISDTLFIEEPTLNDVVRVLVRLRHQAVEGGKSHYSYPPKLLLPLQAGRAFFCLGGTMGSTGYQSHLARSLGPAYPYYGVHFPGYNGEEEPLDRVEAIAARCLEEIQQIQPTGPYLLGGHSFGGMVAYEMACQLLEQGEEVRNVCLFDTFLLIPGQQTFPHDAALATEEVASSFRLMQELAGEMIDSDSALFLNHDHFTDYHSGTLTTAVDVRIANIVQVHQASLDAMIRYQVRPSDIPVTLFKAIGAFQPAARKTAASTDPTSIQTRERQIQLSLDDATNGWGSIGLPNLHVVYVPGNHYNMFMPPYTDTLAAVLRKCFEASHVWGESGRDSAFS